MRAVNFICHKFVIKCSFKGEQSVRGTGADSVVQSLDCLRKNVSVMLHVE